MTPDISFKATRGLFWSGLESLSLRGTQLLIGILMARLLLPEDFGLIAMLAIFIAVAQVFLDSGFGAALVQKRRMTDLDTSSVFYFNIIAGAAAAALIFAAAPFIAAFYGQPALTPLARTISLVLVINSFAVVPAAILTRKIDFKTQAKVSLAAMSCAGLVGVTMAFSGFGAWSLVAQQLSGALVGVALLWLLSGWRPRLLFSFRSIGKMLSFGSRLMATDLLYHVFENIYYVVIGRLFTPASLAFFARAKHMSDMPMQTIGNSVARVTFPVFSSIQHDPERLRRGCSRALAVLVMVSAPVMIGIAVVARPLVAVLLTEKWLPAVPYLRLLCLAGLLYPLHLMNLNILKAMGRSDHFLRLSIVKTLMVAFTIAIVWRWGIMALVIGLLVLDVISCYINAWYTPQLIGYRLRDQFADIWPYLAIAAVMGSIVYLVGFLPLAADIVMLGAQVCTGVAVYLGLCLIFRPPAWQDAIQSGRRHVEILKAVAV